MPQLSIALRRCAIIKIKNYSSLRTNRSFRIIIYLPPAFRNPLIIFLSRKGAKPSAAGRPQRNPAPTIYILREMWTNLNKSFASCLRQAGLCGFARIIKPFTCRRRSEMKIKGVYYFGFIYLAVYTPLHKVSKFRK
jgi:hypothetical protein